MSLTPPLSSLLSSSSHIPNPTPLSPSFLPPSSSLLAFLHPILLSYLISFLHPSHLFLPTHSHPLSHLGSPHLTFPLLTFSSPRFSSSLFSPSLFPLPFSLLSLHFNHSLPPDVDECALRIHNCVRRSRCINTIGSYTCVCPGNISCFGKTSHG